MIYYVFLCLICRHLSTNESGFEFSSCGHVHLQRIIRVDSDVESSTVSTQIQDASAGGSSAQKTFQIPLDVKSHPVTFDGQSGQVDGAGVDQRSWINGI